MSINSICGSSLDPLGKKIRNLWSRNVWGLVFETHTNIANPLARYDKFCHVWFDNQEYWR